MISSVKELATQMPPNQGFGSPDRLSDVVETLFRKQGLSTAITSGGGLNKMFVNVRIAGVVGNGIKFVNLSIEKEADSKFIATWNLEYTVEHLETKVDRGETMVKAFVRTINRTKDTIEALERIQRETEEDIKLLRKIRTVIQILSTLPDPA